ncbi:MAG: Crp/Fnr family transcriptional regulator [Burkholderiaceae bacterium]|nr:Crp/Fnr family transcriptional regulator [Burkholderiaceae bacterium]
MTLLRDHVDALLALYPAIAALDAALRDPVLVAHASAARVPPATVLFEEGAPCRGFPLVLAGEVRVARGTPNGRSIELYRVTPGELCVASTSCLFGHGMLAAHGVTTQTTDLVVLDAAGFHRWTEHEPFRRFVFGIFADRLADLMALAEAVAFQRLDQRLAGTLLGHGTVVVREIVTRLLKRFERQGWVRVARERIEIVEPAALCTPSPPASPSGRDRRSVTRVTEPSSPAA